MKCKNISWPPRKCRRPNFELAELQEMLVCLEQNQELATGVLGTVVKSIADQRVAWDAIAEKVNALSTHNRTRREIREKWRDLKARVKTKAIANARHALAKASGPMPTPLNDLEQRVLNLVGKVFRIEEISTAFGFAHGSTGVESSPSSPPIHRSSSAILDFLGAQFEEHETLDDVVHVEATSHSEDSPVSLEGNDDFQSPEPDLTESADPNVSLSESTPCSESSLVILPVCSDLPLTDNRPKSEPTTSENHIGEVDSILCGSIKELISLQQKIYTVEAQRLAVEQQRLQVEKQRLEVDKKKLELKERTLIWKLHRSD